jgi:hypothetical protein
LDLEALEKETPVCRTRKRKRRFLRRVVIDVGLDGDGLVGHDSSQWRKQGRKE